VSNQSVSVSVYVNPRLILFARLIVRKSRPLGLRRTRQWPFTVAKPRETPCRRTPKPGKSLCVPCAFVAKTKSVLICTICGSISFILSLCSLCPLWPQKQTMKTPKNHLFSPLLSFTLPRLSSFVLRSSSLLPKSRSAKKWFKNCSFLLIFAQNAFIFAKKNAKKCKKTLIFTLIFRLKTNKSYKITSFAATNHPIFQNFPQKPLFPPIFRLFFSFFTPFFFRLLSSVLCLPASSDRSHRLGARIPVTGPRFCAFYEWKEAGC
jgi:hypothetical protein